MDIMLLICLSAMSLVVHLTGSHSLPQNEVSALMAFKTAILEDPHLALSSWDAHVYQAPCNWTGIYCALDHVITLNISNSLLKGFITRDIHKLTFLRKLILHNNSITGAIPREIGMIDSLRVLDLSINCLSGSIPHELGHLSNVKEIYLQLNGLTGTIPFDLSYLRNLTELRLDRNRLEGVIPGGEKTMSTTSNVHKEFSHDHNETGFCKLRMLKNADFSYNFLVGYVPPCLKYNSQYGFQGNCLRDNDVRPQRSKEQCASMAPFRAHQPPKPEKRQSIISKQHASTRSTWLLSLEVISGTIALLLLLLAIFASMKRGRRKPSIIIPWKRTESLNDELILSTDAELLKDAMRITRQELEMACEDFSNIIGTSPYSVVYKGTLKEDGQEIAVISLSVHEEYWTNYLELYFQREVADLARLNHENVGKLLGYCREYGPLTRMLVFEYASNGTLYDHLNCKGISRAHILIASPDVHLKNQISNIGGVEGQLSWRRRMRIALGIAHGLKYMHCDIQPPFIISELNSRTVYLTEDFSPKLVDFERWKTILSKKNPDMMCRGGAFCCLRGLETSNVTVQENIFAFGVLLLEIISGKSTYCEEKGLLLDRAREYLELPEAMSYLVDSDLTYFRYEELQIICEVISLCVQIELAKCPSMHSLYAMMVRGIDVSPEIILKDSPLAWAELAITS